MGWSEKYKKSINCDNPKGFSQRAHCQGRKKKMNEAKEKDHEVSMAKTQVKKSIDNLQKVARVLAKKTDADNLPAWVQAKLTDTEHNTDAAASYMTDKEDLDEGKKKCGEGKYWCKTDEKCKKIPSGHHVMPNGDLMKDSEHEESGDVSEGKRDGKSAKDKGYSLRDWFKGGGWVQAGGKYDGKPCARQPGQKTKPFCRDADDRAAMSKEERNKRAKKKRKEDPNPNRKGKAKMVREAYDTTGTRFEKMKGDPVINALKATKEFKQMKGELVKTAPVKLANSFCNWRQELELSEEGKKDACYHKVKSRYSVWPSAYASGALVKCRKVGAKNWGNKTKNESYEFSNWRDDFKPTEYEFVDLIKPEPIKGLNEAKSTKDRLKEVSKQLAGASKMHAKQSKVVAKCADELDEAKKCWKGYEKKGTQKLFGKTYNRCVKKEEFSNWREELAEELPRTSVDVGDKFKGKAGMMPDKEIDTANKGIGNIIRGTIKLHKAHFEPEGEIIEGAAWTKKSGKNPKGGLNEKGRKSYERENPGSDLKAPSKKVGNKRRASFCARMKGMKKKLTSKKTANDPNSRINKSLRAWNC